MIERCGGQVRAGMGAPYGLDFGAVLMLADAMGAMSSLLAEVLPLVEPIVLSAYRDEGSADDH